MPNPVKSLGCIYSSNSPRPVKGSSNAIRYNCQKIRSWSRRPKSIPKIRKNATYLKVINDPIIFKFFNEFTNHRKKTNRAVFIPLPYLLTSGLMQDVAYGIRDLKYNSVEVKTTPIIILKAKHSHVITSDIQKYNMSQFQHLSGKTLLRLMLDIMLFQRHGLADLDDITADRIVSHFCKKGYPKSLRQKFIDTRQKEQQYLKGN